MASLPAMIFQFALSPYKDWQRLAWAGALIITLAVLALSIAARALGAKGRQNDRDEAPICRRRSSVRGLEFLLWRDPGAEKRLATALCETGDLVHRAVGLRKIDPAARPEPHV